GERGAGTDEHRGDEEGERSEGELEQEPDEERRVTEQARMHGARARERLAGLDLREEQRRNESEGRERQPSDAAPPRTPRDARRGGRHGARGDEGKEVTARGAPGEELARALRRAEDGVRGRMTGLGACEGDRQSQCPREGSSPRPQCNRLRSRLKGGPATTDICLECVAWLSSLRLSPRSRFRPPRPQGPGSCSGSTTTWANG